MTHHVVGAYPRRRGPDVTLPEGVLGRGVTLEAAPDFLEREVVAAPTLALVEAAVLHGPPPTAHLRMRASRALFPHPCAVLTATPSHKITNHSRHMVEELRRLLRSIKRTGKLDELGTNTAGITIVRPFR